ncbi:ParB/RepB/Spo0J family partition protein [Thermovenabulum gondwanense]|uniref:Putative chromosome-partitioning protein ParB n=1 Tax=Thermovenabulum gondwanense TaxID=520767 RepID=A0A162MSM8_9FIRM|nr:ParB/RepB/Spo0J family partition protein [Thermovenabulum gondwanense]KYO67237.1 putative chromosome-partitioning protein ParB [Thermovenabulum gondwanense]
MPKKALGKGLGALIPLDEGKEENLIEIDVDKIYSRENQPRKNFDEEKLIELAESIKTHGIIQPIILKKTERGYEIVAGERRWRAAKIAGLKKIPAVVKELTREEIMEVALIENIQREDLNPIEEAEAYRTLIEQCGLTQEELAKKLGKSRPFIANTLRLLNLDDEIKSMMIKGEISSGHARALLALEDSEERMSLAKKILKEGLSVRETEEFIKKARENRTKENFNKDRGKEGNRFNDVEEILRSALGTKVKIKGSGDRGKIEIEFYSKEDLERIIELITI